MQITRIVRTLALLTSLFVLSAAPLAAQVDLSEAIVPVDALDGDWAITEQDVRPVPEGSRYGVVYESQDADGFQVAVFLLIDTGSPEGADALLATFLDWEQQNGFTEVPWGGLGDGAAYQGKKTSQSQEFSVAHYMFRMGGVFALVEVYGPEGREGPLASKALGHATMQHERLHTMLGVPAGSS